MRRVLFGVVCAVGLACGSGGDNATLDAGPDAVVDAAPTYTNVVVDPPDATLTVPIAGGATQNYKAYADTAGQTHVDVTSQCTFHVADASLGTFGAATFTSAARGGDTVVTATCGGGQGTGNLHLLLKGWILGAGAPNNAPTIFANSTAGSDATRTPTVEYPLDGAVAPLNIPAIDTQWTTAQDDLFHLSWTSKHIAIDLYTTAADAQFADPVWANVAASASGDAIAISVEGLKQASPTQKFASAAVTLDMSHDVIDNTAIYWWASSQGSLITQTFGQTGAPTVVKGSCTSCHSVSRSGSRIGYSRCVNNNCSTLYAGFMRYDTANKVWNDTVNADGMAIHGSFTTFSPIGYPYADDKQSLSLVTMATGNLSLYDPDTGAAVPSNVETVSTHGPGQPRAGLMADWSPDGKTIVFASTPHPGQWIDLSNSSLATMTYTYANSTHTFGEPTFIVPGPITLTSGTYDNLFFPSFSPDGAYIVFNAARAAWRDLQAGQGATPGQRLMMTDPTGSWTVDLANLNGPGDLDTTWPHWAPSNSSDYYWVVFSTERPYGHKLTKSNTAAACVTNGVLECKQIWIAAISKSTLAAKSPPDDPSAPPVWMPGQDLGADNISPYWTLPTSAIPQ
jgi:Tol biopolymer transport system component